MTINRLYFVVASLVMPFPSDAQILESVVLGNATQTAEYFFYREDNEILKKVQKLKPIAGSKLPSSEDFGAFLGVTFGLPKECVQTDIVQLNEISAGDKKWSITYNVTENGIVSSCSFKSAKCRMTQDEARKWACRISNFIAREFGVNFPEPRLAHYNRKFVDKIRADEDAGKTSKGSEEWPILCSTEIRIRGLVVCYCISDTTLGDKSASIIVRNIVLNDSKRREQSDTFRKKVHSPQIVEEISKMASVGYTPTVHPESFDLHLLARNESSEMNSLYGLFLGSNFSEIFPNERLYLYSIRENAHCSTSAELLNSVSGIHVAALSFTPLSHKLYNVNFYLHTAPDASIGDLNNLIERHKDIVLKSLVISNNDINSKTLHSGIKQYKLTASDSTIRIFYENTNPEMHGTIYIVWSSKRLSEMAQIECMRIGKVTLNYKFEK